MKTDYTDSAALFGRYCLIVIGKEFRINFVPSFQCYRSSCETFLVIMADFQSVWVYGQHAIIEVVEMVRAWHDDVFGNIRTTVLFCERFDIMDTGISNIVSLKPPDVTELAGIVTEPFHFSDEPLFPLDLFTQGFDTPRV